MLTIIGWIILSLILLSLAVIFFPYTIIANGQISQYPGTMKSNGFFGLGFPSWGMAVHPGKRWELMVGPYKKPWFRFQLPAKSESQKKKKTQRSAAKKSEEKKSGHFNRKMIRPLVCAVHRHIHWKRLDLKGQLGLSNPMTTGMLFGLTNGLLSTLSCERCRVNIFPVFNDLPATNLTGSLALRISPGVMGIHLGWIYLKHKT